MVPKIAGPGSEFTLYTTEHILSITSITFFPCLGYDIQQANIVKKKNIWQANKSKQLPNEYPFLDKAMKGIPICICSVIPKIDRTWHILQGCAQMKNILSMKIIWIPHPSTWVAHMILRSIWQNSYEINMMSERSLIGIKFVHEKYISQYRFVS